jgi:FkbM family methyltransferase
MTILGAHLRRFWHLWQRFENPLLVAMLRLGFLKLKYFPYAISKGRNSYLMLGRPTSTEMGDLFVLREVLSWETYGDVLPLLPRRGLRVVDIGANIGAFTIWLSQTAKVDEAFCFEPEPDSFRLLRFNLSTNNCGFAHALDKAVGGQSRAARIRLNEDNPPATNIYRTAPDPGRPLGNAIQVVALSEWLGQTPGAFDLLKMDCEGSEWEIVRGTGQSEFARFGTVVAEVHCDPEGLHAVEEFHRLMEARGFRTVRWDRKSQGLYVGVRVPQSRESGSQ